jgi:methionyl-tRNA formyltransferase
MMNKELKFAFFGSSRFSYYVLDELRKAGYEPAVNVTDARAPLPALGPEIEFGIVASFGKILPQSYLEVPPKGFLNVHPSLLPALRGPAPLQNLILGASEPGVTIIKMDEKMDHGPILAQEKVSLAPWPDHYAVVEEKLGRAGGALLAHLLPAWRAGSAEARPQDDAQATYVKMIKKEDGLLNLSDPAETNVRKVLAYSTWPGAYFFFKRRHGDEIRVVVRDAEIKDGLFVPTRVIPAGKREMPWSDFLRGNQ